MNRLVVGNLLHRPIRSIISVLAVAIEVIMILSIVAIMVGQVNGARKNTGGVGADLIVRPANASFINGMGGAPVPAKIATVLAKLPHVAVASPAIANFSMSNAVETIWGIDYESYNALRPFTFIAGGPFTGPNDVIVDDVFARTDKGHHVGEMIPILNHQYRICGIVESGKGGRKYLPIRTLGALLGGENNASLFYIKADDPKNDGLIRQEIKSTEGLGDYQVQTMEEYFSMMTPNHLPAFNIALRVVIGIAVIIGFLAIFQAMYTAVMERTREIGILKSLGASQAYIVNVVLRETALISICGIVLGTLFTELIKVLLSYRFPTLQFYLTGDWRVKAAAIAFVGSMVGALYPALKAARKDPIDALAYE